MVFLNMEIEEDINIVKVMFEFIFEKMMILLLMMESVIIILKSVVYKYNVNEEVEK